MRKNKVIIMEYLGTPTPKRSKRWWVVNFLKLSGAIALWMLVMAIIFTNFGG
jgi:hypothetical protein